MKILYLCHRFPFPPKRGGKIRPFNMIQHFAREHEVTVGSHAARMTVGYHIEPGVGLGHRRLSIIDVSTGQQPLYNEDGSVVVVFNGEIYNFKELIPELSALGHRFRTKSDTEVIVHGWEAWGASCVTRFRGMFAFAPWHRNVQTLFLARDRLGVRPLHYALLTSSTARPMRRSSGPLEPQSAGSQARVRIDQPVTPA